MRACRETKWFSTAMLLLASIAARCQEVRPVKPMAKEAHPSFEVATIKPHDPAVDDGGFSTDGERVNFRNERLAQMMMFAFSVYRTQIEGLPAWAKEPWDIEGRADAPGEPDGPQQQEMMAKLLVERFGLKFHREKRELPVYLIELAKGGPKMKPAAKPDEASGQHFHGENGVAILQYTSTDMAAFVLGEAFVVDQPLIDRTELKGKFDFTLRYNFRETAPTSDASVPGLFTAVQEELGLKFVPAKTMVDVLVIDHVDRPSAN